MLGDTASLDALPMGIGSSLPLLLPLLFGKLDALTDDQLAANLRRVSLALAEIADGPAIDVVSRETPGVLIPPPYVAGLPNEAQAFLAEQQQEQEPAEPAGE